MTIQSLQLVILSVWDCCGCVQERGGPIGALGTWSSLVSNSAPNDGEVP